MFNVNPVPSGTDNITAASGSSFAQAPANTGVHQARGYSSFFPTGGFTTSVDIYLDMDKVATPAARPALRLELRD